MFNDIIEVLLNKKATLRAEIEREFAERSEKIDALLALAGYEPPAVEEPVEVVDDAEQEQEGINNGAIVY